jgi:hypothetical protein
MLAAQEKASPSLPGPDPRHAGLLCTRLPRFVRAAPSLSRKGRARPFALRKPGRYGLR